MILQDYNIFGFILFFFVLNKSTSANLIIRQVPVPQTRHHLTQGPRWGHLCGMDTFLVCNIGQDHSLTFIPMSFIVSQFKQSA